MTVYVQTDEAEERMVRPWPKLFTMGMGLRWEVRIIVFCAMSG